MLARLWREGNPCSLLVECKLVQLMWKTGWKFLKKLKIELPYDPAIPLLSTYPKNPKTLDWKHTCTPMFTAGLFTIAKIWKQHVFINRWMDKEYVYMYIYTIESSAAIKKCNFAICKNMNGPREYYVKWNKSDIERQILYIITYMWNLKNKTNKCL